MEANVLKGLNILVLEDDLWERKQLVHYLESKEAKVFQAEDLKEAREVLHKETLDFAILDIQLPDGSGLELVKASPLLKEIPTVFVTSMDSVEMAVEAMKLGATDYLIKPCPTEKLGHIYENWRQRSRGRRRERWSEASGQKVDETLFHGAGWKSLQGDLKRLLDAEERLETTLPPVLITGETGTGKSTLARYLHRQGPRSGLPFVEVNSSHLSEQLAESELFGHEKGAFTDARERKIGLFEAADGGTLFLDEVTQLDAKVQSKLLTVLENQTIRRVGGLESIKVDVRLIVATNVNPDEEVKAGRFREDLYHRLSLVRLNIPPLRQCTEDLPDLSRHLFAILKRRYNRPEAELSTEAIKRIQLHGWPGNIRELRHELERALIFTEEDEIHLPTLPDSWEEDSYSGDPPEWLNADWRIPEEGFSLKKAEKVFINMALSQTENNQSASARLLGIPRHVLRYRLQGRSTEE